MNISPVEKKSAPSSRPIDEAVGAAVLIVEDERDLAEEICLELQSNGHPVQLAETVHDGLLAARSGVAVLIIDRMLHGEDGLSIIETLRAEGNTTPALVISALSSVDERINGLKAGGDDYLVKPFDIRELTARVEALLRRGGDARVTRLQVGALEMDLVERTVQCDGKPVDLLPREFTLARIFHAPPRPDRNPDDAARGCVEFQIHGANQCRRRSDRQLAAQARPHRRTTLHRQHPRCRLQAECGRLTSSTRGRFAWRWRSFSPSRSR